ncbi:MAG: hypothetical protein AAF213_10435 [Pseudomonadota bacterium]
MPDKDDRRAQALRANLKRRKNWQRGQKADVKAQGDATQTDTSQDDHIQNDLDKPKG